jgi:DNA invertase Pin-like site-specific DNA recombinase
MTKFIYARTSTTEQDVKQQAKLLSEAYKGAVVNIEQVSGSSLDRPVLQELVGRLKAGDDLVIYDLSRLSRNTADFLGLLEDFNNRDIGLIIHSMGGQPVDSRSAIGKMILTVLAATATMERDLMLEKQKIGIATAKKAGKYLGRKPVDSKKIDRALQLIDSGTTKQEAAAAVGVGVATIYRALKK